MINLQKPRRAIGRYFAEPLVKLISKTSITPNGLTWIGLIIAVVAAVLAATGHLFAAGWVVAFSGLFDMLDGSLARLKNQSTKFGAVLDSTLDRVGEAVALLGLTIYYLQNPSLTGILLTGLTLIASQLVSYIRARAEAINVNCEVGVFTRPERIVILSLGLLFSRFNPVLLIALGLMALLSWITAGQRLFYVWQKTK
ncbi:MAG: CDP-alcohol phosphatidyltransferase family protein [Dehalococcoidales bacterium]|nr:CDP-alcohol phosphatidyltransferase family protein [Dehalococcoidales bacterium]